MIAIPSSLTESASAVTSATNEMAGLSSDACAMFGTMGSLLGSAQVQAMKQAEHAVHAATEALAGVAKFVGGLMSKVSGIVSSLMANIANLGAAAIATIHGLLASIGSAVSGVVAGIASAVDSVKGAVADVFSNLGSLVKGFSLNGCSGVKVVAASAGSEAGEALASVNQFAVDGNMAGTAVGAAASSASGAAKLVAEGAVGSLGSVVGSISGTTDGLIAQLEAFA